MEDGEVSCEARTKDCQLAGLVQGSAEWNAVIELAVITSLLSL